MPWPRAAAWKFGANPPSKFSTARSGYRGRDGSWDLHCLLSGGEPPDFASRRPGLPAAILKVGTLDDPALSGTPQMAIFTIDKQAFHQIPEGLPSFERLPKRR